MKERKWKGNNFEKEKRKKEKKEKKLNLNVQWNERNKEKLKLKIFVGKLNQINEREKIRKLSTSFRLHWNWVKLTNQFQNSYICRLTTLTLVFLPCRNG